jgi:Ca-activated chloride channel homolog
MRIEARQDRTLIRSGASSTRYALVSLRAPAAPPRTGRIPVNVALVLDRSGSMGGAKIQLARQAVEQAIRQLRPEDRFSIVIYDTQVDLLVEPTLATGDAKRRALLALATATPRGGTDLAAGWLRGCEAVRAHASPETVNRCLLLTDGLANHGLTDQHQIARHVTEYRSWGVQSSTFGVGGDFDERLLQSMADAGGGRSYYVEAPAGIPELMSSELGEALEVVLPEAVVELRMPAGVHAEPLSAYPARQAGSVLRVEVGDLVSGQHLDLVVKLYFPGGGDAEVARVEFGVVDREGQPCAPADALQWAWAGHPENDAQPRNVEVDRAVAELYAARARAEATELNRVGDLERARRVLEATARRIRSYAGGDPVLLQIAATLIEETTVFAAPMDALVLKEQSYVAYAATRSRDPRGRSRRQPPPVA